jgi:hypothetical protein
LSFLEIGDLGECVVDYVGTVRDWREYGNAALGNQ